MANQPTSSAMAGYEALVTESSGPGYSWLLRRQNAGGGFTDLATVNSATSLVGNLLLLRINGSAVEMWVSTDFGANWTLMLTANDTTYRGPFYVVAGATGGTAWWDYIGGGLRSLRQIYRVIKAPVF